MNATRTERVQAVLDRWAQGDFGFLPEPYHPEIEFVMGPGFPDSGTYMGVDEIVEYTRGLLEPWERLTITPAKLEVVGDAVISEVYQRGTGTGSGIETGFTYWIVWTFRDDSVVRWENFRERSDAYAAAGAG